VSSYIIIEAFSCERRFIAFFRKVSVFAKKKYQHFPFFVVNLQWLMILLIKSQPKFTKPNKNEQKKATLLQLLLSTALLTTATCMKALIRGNNIARINHVQCVSHSSTIQLFNAHDRLQRKTTGTAAAPRNVAQPAE
jgi:hypothetical protein